MRWLRKGLRGFDKSKNETPFESEIAFHLEAVTQANIRAGMSSDEARRRAVLGFGGMEQVKQQVRDVHVSRLLEGMRFNLRSSMRFIRRSPSFALAVVLTLAIGIGANSAVFSAIDAILLRPLSFPHGDELVRLHQLNLKSKDPETFVAPLRLADWDRMNSTFQAISGYYTEDISFVASSAPGTLPEKVTEALVAPGFLKLWGTSPLYGRDFTNEELKFGGPNAVLVSNRLWRTHLNSDRNAVGKPLRLADHSYAIVGIMPASFLFPDRDVDVWTPSQDDAPYAQSRASTWYTVMGRLKPGVTFAQASADLATIQSQLAMQYPKTDSDFTVHLEPLKLIVIGNIGSSLWLLYASVSLLLLIACTNIAALLMARTAEREHEISIRYSLGASRSAIFYQLLTEAFVLAMTGAILGLAIAAGASHIFALLSKDLPRVEEISLNWRIVLYSLGCALGVTFLCGLLPAIRGTGSGGAASGLSHSLARSSRTQVAAHNPWQWTLLGAQVSLAVALLIASGLLLRSFQALGRVQPGFDPDHVLTLRISAGWGETADRGKLIQRVNRTLDGLRSVPGVQAAATSGTIPGNTYSYPVELSLPEGPQNSPNSPRESVMADMHFISAGYFDTLRIPLLQGEACRDGATSETAVVNRAFVEKYFPNAGPVGRHLGLASTVFPINPAEIRGIVGNAREQGIDTLPHPAVYWCDSAPTPDPNYLVRVEGDPMAMVDTLRRKILELEPARSVSNIMPLEEHLDDRQAENRLRTILLTLFAVVAISLFSIGLYGTISYLGRTRQREVGLRLVLGALRRQIVGRFLVQGMRVTVIGAMVGLLLAGAMNRLLAGMLFGISPFDAVTYVGVTVLTLLIAAAASFFPSFRASRVNPVEVLREQ